MANDAAKEVKAPRASWVWPGVALAVVAAGFLGLDRWFYEHVSRVLNTEDQPFDRDFYTLTKPLWLVCRFVFAHVLGGLAIYVAVLLLEPRRWRQTTAGLVAVLAAASLANLAQVAIGRLRPNQADTHLAFTQPLAALSGRQHVSFPSGEAATAVALACVLTRLFPRWKAAWYVLGTLGAVARLVNGAHYVSDVAAGALLGSLLAGLTWPVAERRLAVR